LSAEEEVGDMVSKKGMNPAALAALKAGRGALQQGQVMPKKVKPGKTAAEQSTASFVEAVITKPLPGVNITEVSPEEAEAARKKRKEVPIGKGKGPMESEAKKQKTPSEVPLTAHNDGPTMLLDAEYRLTRFRGMLTPPDKKILETFESRDLFKDTVARSIEVSFCAFCSICLSLFYR
jgi:hypothetical protein